MRWLRRGEEILARGRILATEPSIPGAGQGGDEPRRDGDGTEAVRPPAVTARRGRGLTIPCDVLPETVLMHLAGPIQYVEGLVHEGLLRSLVAWDHPRPSLLVGPP